MTIHIHKKDHVCPECSALYIPYTPDVTCPRCGHTSEPKDDYSNIVKECVASLIFNKNEYDSFIPPAWSIICFVDVAQNIMFRAFETVEKEGGKDFETFIDNFLKKVKAHDYQKKNLKGFLMAVKQRLDTGKD